MEKDTVYVPAASTVYRNTLSNPAKDDWDQELLQFIWSFVFDKSGKPA